VSATDQSRLRSRRALLAGAGVAATVALAGCGGKPLREKIRSGGAKVPPEDAATLNALLDVENFGIAAYAAGIPLLSSTGSTTAKWLLGQELAHAAELEALIKAAGAKPHKLAATYNLGDPRTATEALALLERAEHAQLHAYLEKIPTLSDGHVRAAIATISANDAQHLAVLRSSGGQMPTQAFPPVG
jgi:Ferritin-like domain